MARISILSLLTCLGLSVACREASAADFQFSACKGKRCNRQSATFEILRPHRFVHPQTGLVAEYLVPVRLVYLSAGQTALKVKMNPGEYAIAPTAQEKCAPILTDFSVPLKSRAKRTVRGKAAKIPTQYAACL